MTEDGGGEENRTQMIALMNLKHSLLRLTDNSDQKTLATSRRESKSHIHYLAASDQNLNAEIEEKKEQTALQRSL